MFVNTNVAAMNAWLNLSNTQNSMTSILQQLSSGLKINSAADNPAGLAISQQMQSEISGMNQAYQNSQTGINLFQTADSALGQIQSILQSMRSLASQAATGTNNPTDLTALQSEMNQYTQQITQVTNDTNFNTLNLLGGGFQGQSIQIGADQGQALQVGVAAADAFSLGVTGLNTSVSNSTTQTVAQNGGLSGGSTINAVGLTPTTGAQIYSLNAGVTPWYVSGTTGASDMASLAGSYQGTASDTVNVKVVSTSQLSVTDTATGTTSTVNLTGGAGTVNVNGSALTLTLAGTAVANDAFSFTVAPTSTAFSVTPPGGTAGPATTVNGVIQTGTNEGATSGSGSVSFATNSQIYTDTTASQSYSTFGTAPAATAVVGATFSVSQSGASATSYTNGTGNATATTGIDITNQSNAQAALTVLGNAINTISGQRASIGAFQNRLQFASSDLQVSSQNLTAAQAQITNADIALQMSNLTKYQILQQAGVGMLAQANAMPQALLKLIP